jgi:hypothetical protein
VNSFKNDDVSLISTIYEHVRELRHLLTRAVLIQVSSPKNFTGSLTHVVYTYLIVSNLNVSTALKDINIFEQIASALNNFHVVTPSK